MDGRVSINTKIYTIQMTAPDILKAVEDYAEHTKNPYMKLLFTILTPLLYSIGSILVFVTQHYTNSEALKLIQIFLGILLAVLSLIWSAWKNRTYTQEILEHFRKILGKDKKPKDKK